MAINNRKSWHAFLKALGAGGGGEEGSDSMDGQECAILALELVSENLIFT